MIPPAVQAIFLALSVVEPDRDIVGAVSTDDEHWEAAARLSVARRTYPLFLKNLNILDLTKRISAQFLAILQDLSDRSRAHTTALLGFSETLFAALERSGISAIPLKGISVARYYPDPSLRPMYDIDILIDRGDFSKCRAVLEGLGFTIADPVCKGVLVNPGQECLFRNRQGTQVDVHYRLFPWYEEEMVYGIATSDFIRRAAPETKGTVLMRRLLPEDEFYYLLLSLHRSHGESHWHRIDMQALKIYFGATLHMERVFVLIKKSPLQGELMGLTEKVEYFGETRARFRGKIFIWSRIREPFHRLKLLSVYAKWQAFKAGGYFKQDFLTLHNPTPDEIYPEVKIAASNAGRWRLNEGSFVRRTENGGELIVDLRSGDCHSFEGVGALIFRSLAEGHDLDMLKKAVIERYPEVSKSQIHRDVDVLVRQLSRKKIILSS